MTNIFTVDDIIKMLLPFFPNLQVEEGIDGELVICTGAKVVSSDGHIAPMDLNPEA